MTAEKPRRHTARRDGPEQEDIHIGKRIRVLRIRRGMSQEALGAAVNLTFQQIQKYERGANRVGGSRMCQIARALRVKPGYFFEDMEFPPAVVDTLTRRDLKLLFWYDLCDEPARRQLCAIAKTVAEAQAEALAATVSAAAAE